MLKVPELNLGSIDAINYKTKEGKEFLSKVLYKEAYLEEILQSKKYFLIGEKGTGKTSYAVFLHNTEYSNTLSRVISLTQTDYRRFVALRKQGKFNVSSYVEIWKVILLLLICDGISNRFPSNIANFPQFAKIKSAIDEYYRSAFRPEVDQSLDIIENSEQAAKLVAAHSEIGAKESQTLKENFPNFQVNLAYLERRFRDAISSLRLPKDFILFIDGIDIRPDTIDYDPYIECIQGLANAVWDINTEFFANIKGAKSRIKVMTLMRPDILDNMGLQNLNAKVHDNGVVLNWLTTYEAFANSPLFHLVSGTISKQQDASGKSNLEIWKHYFPYEYENLRIAEKMDDPFIGLLRYSFYRPRDIIKYLQFMQEYVKNMESAKEVFSRESFFDCQRVFSDYLLGEVKDYLSFYHSTVDFDEVVGFFSEFGGKNEFTYDQFVRAFNNHKVRLRGRKITIKELVASPDEFLQFLYSLNIVGYIEQTDIGGNFIHYCFRDRTTVKLRPKVRFGLNYHVHPGLQRALLVGSGSSTGQRRRRRPRSS